MLLRNRSRAVTKPGLMGDHSSQSCPNHSYKRTIPSLFASPKFRDFTVKCFSGAEALRSPTSILDTRALSPFSNPLSHEAIISPKLHSENKIDAKGIGLALVDSIHQSSAKPNSGNVLLGTKLRVKTPPSFTCAAAVDFGDKTKDSPLVSGTYVVSLSEMELSEEYTCVISHGPNPKTTHIFHNCIVESYSSIPNSPHSPSQNFLSFCYTCKNRLQHTKDIFIYRGDKAFCSEECRHQEILLDDAQNSEFDTYS
ncbi:hypothetical protein VNO77_16446 [Canavalia gladiata]|uniref:FLZ-type domain-containing protein n=1 Tax=Canavalia gladiata TaxID=3824 RepID=A0AAN9M444_CANGL